MATLRTPRRSHRRLIASHVHMTNIRAMLAARSACSSATARRDKARTRRRLRRRCERAWTVCRGGTRMTRTPPAVLCVRAASTRTPAACHFAMHVHPGCTAEQGFQIVLCVRWDASAVCPFPHHSHHCLIALSALVASISWQKAKLCALHRLSAYLASFNTLRVPTHPCASA